MKPLYVLAGLCILGALGLSTLVIAHDAVEMRIHTDPVRVEKGKQTLITITLEGIVIDECDCTVILKNHGEEMLRVPLIPEDTHTAAPLPITFVTEGTYDVAVEGTPKTPDAFAPFTAKGHVRVGAFLSRNSSEIVRYALLGGAILIAGFVLWRERRVVFGRK